MSPLTGTRLIIALYPTPFRYISGRYGIGPRESSLVVSVPIALEQLLTIGSGGGYPLFLKDILFINKIYFIFSFQQRSFYDFIHLPCVLIRHVPTSAATVKIKSKRSFCRDLNACDFRSQLKSNDANKILTISF